MNFSKILIFAVMIMAVFAGHRGHHSHGKKVLTTAVSVFNILLANNIELIEVFVQIF